MGCRLIAVVGLMASTMGAFAGGVDATKDGRVLILDKSGGLFLASSDKTIRLDVEMPTNGAEFLQEQMAEGDFGDVLDAMDHLRYSDVMLAQDGADRALVVSYTEFHIDENCFTSTLTKFTIPTDQTLDEVKITSDDWVDLARSSCLEPFEDGLPTYGLKAGGRLAQVNGDTERVIWTVGDDADVLDVNLSDGDYSIIARDR